MKDKKRVILSDRGAWFVESILENTDWIIELLVVDDFGRHKEKYEANQRIKKILTLNELMRYEEKFEYDNEDIKKYLHLFNISDYGLRRIRDDLFFSHYQFYLTYSFWKGILSSSCIDLCLIVNHIHGFPSDCVLQEMCKNMSICCYNIYPHFAGKYAIYSINRNELLANAYGRSETDLSKVANYVTNRNFSEGIDELPYGKILKIIYKFGGSYGVRLLALLVKGRHQIHYRESNFAKYIAVSKHIRHMRKYTRKYYSNVEKDKKYIIYFLHFEPEAVITSFTDSVDSQLYFIKMLSRVIPKDWVLYVKEHPDFFKLKQWVMEYHIPVMDTFYTEFFYDTIQSMQNVKLLDYKIKAGELIKKSMAVSTIAGTVMSEAILNKKPIIMFSGEKHLYSKNKEIFCPQTYSELENAVSAINEGFTPSYADIDTQIEAYLFDTCSSGKRQVIGTIEKDARERNE